MFDVLELQKQLVAAANPSGSEYKSIAPLLAELAKPFVDEVYTDAMGNVICHKKGSGKKIMLCAHMDAIGLPGYRQELTSADAQYVPAFDGTGV